MFVEQKSIIKSRSRPRQSLICAVSVTASLGITPQGLFGKTHPLTPQGLSGKTHPSYITRIVWYNTPLLHHKDCLVQHTTTVTNSVWYNTLLLHHKDCVVQHTTLVTNAVWYNTLLLHHMDFLVKQTPLTLQGLSGTTRSS